MWLADQFPVQEIHVAEETKASIELTREEAPNPSYNGELSGWEEDNEEVSVEEDYKEVPVVEEVSAPEVIGEVPEESQLVVDLQPKIEEVLKKSYASIVSNH